MISDVIRARLVAAGEPFRANDNIAAVLDPGDLDKLEAEVAERVRDLLLALVIDIDDDHNTRETAQRVAKMYLREVFRGRYVARPKITEFPNAKALDEIYTVGPITVRSACSHHLVPIVGHAWIGVKPGADRVIGLSKFNRLTEWIMARPQIQEEATVQLADEIQELLKPEGLAVVIRASHQCMTWRGVKDSGTLMVTSIMRGFFREDAKARDELMSLLRGQGY